ncbi:MAG: autotransporter assembly complex family protein [Wenzhouxiangellaceae bacterium]
MTRWIVLLCVLGLVWGPAGEACAQTISTEIEGISGKLLDNVQASLSLKRAESMPRVSVWRLRRMALRAEDEIRRALEPYGYYRPVIDVRLIEPEQDGAPWRARIRVQPGEPVRVASVQLDLGEAAELPAFAGWLASWPLPEGAVLEHRPYMEALEALERLAEAQGYFGAHFAERRIEVDPDRGEARIRVVLAPGPRYRIGKIVAENEVFDDALIQRLTVLAPGQPYNRERIERQRQTLIHSGYFSSVAIEETRRHDQARVDLRLALEARPANTYRVLAGFGTDTGFRIQTGWTRHWLSGRGDRLDLQAGARQTDREFAVRGLYEHPLGRAPEHFGFAELLLKRERDGFRFEDADRIEPVFEPLPGDRKQAQLTLGRRRDLPIGGAALPPVRERLFVTVLEEAFDAFPSGVSATEEQRLLIEANPELIPFLDRTNTTLAVGGEWRWVRIEGEKFDMHGVHLRGRVLGALESFGAATSFAQGYLEGRWHWRFGEHHKLLLRGELGYTQADTQRFEIGGLPNDPRSLSLEITELPELFRFKAGGDRSVRGYGFEQLSTNRNGANHLLTASIEYERRLFGDYSAAVFYDVGNAFNDFTTMKLKRSVGIGVRWYTVVGPLQLDLARPLDDSGFRIHFTIGTRLR